MAKFPKLNTRVPKTMFVLKAWHVPKALNCRKKATPIITMLVIVDEHPENAVRRFSVPYLSDRVFCRIGPENEEVGNRRAEKK